MAVLAIVVMILFGSTLLYVTSGKAAGADQPINFPHAAMVQAGVTCIYCHTDAMRSMAAGMPSVEKCMGCHKTIATTKPEVIKLKQYWDDQQAIEWVRLIKLPRFVYFSHQAHVQAGAVNCETCHGDVGNMKTTVQTVNMNMGWCLTCHEKQPNSPQIKECFVCHQ
jgi:c(7)-type cytochrome triheme protein